MTRNQQRETEITIKKEKTADDEIAVMKYRIEVLEDEMIKSMIEKGIARKEEAVEETKITRNEQNPEEFQKLVQDLKTKVKQANTP